jgi:CRP-like cAMP-binding protein
MTEKEYHSWDREERASFFAAVRWFEELPPDTLQSVARFFRPKRFKRGEFVFVEGAPADTVNLLAQGRVKVVRETEDGQEVIIRLINPGDLFGGAGGWGEPVYPSNALTQEDAVVLQMPSEQFVRLIATDSDFAAAMVKELGRRLRESEARISELQTERVERRIAHVLLRLARKTGVKTAQGIEIRTPLSRQDLAELSGTTLSTASRTLSAWDKQQIVIAGREHVIIRAPHRLVAIAEDLQPDNGTAGSEKPA